MEKLPQLKHAHHVATAGPLSAEVQRTLKETRVDEHGVHSRNQVHHEQSQQLSGGAVRGDMR